MAVTNEVGETEGQKVSPKKLTLSSDADLFYQEEAATQISDQQGHTAGQRKRLQDDMFNAIFAGELDAYDMRTSALLHLPFEMTKPVCVRVADVNDWAKRTGKPWQWISPNVRIPVAGVVAEALAGPVVGEIGMPRQPLVAQPAVGARVIQRDMVSVPSQQHSTKTPRRDSITPVIEIAQSRCRNPQDTAEVWAQMEALALDEVPPFQGCVVEGLKYTKKGEVHYFTRDALRLRLHPERRAPRK